MVLRLLFGLTLLATPVAAFAARSVPVPEGSQATLFSLGLLGVIIGRRASMRRPESDED